MHFLIFIPNVQGPSPQNLIDVGLGDLLRPDDDQPGCFDLSGRTPSCEPGQLWGWITAGKQSLQFEPQTQKWIAAKPHGDLQAGRYWIGWDADSPPTPDELLRKRTIPGYEATLGDDQLWLIPNAAEVPSRYDLDDAGQWVTRALDRYRGFVERAAWAFDFCQRMIEAEYQLPFPPEAVPFALEAMNWNYRLPRELAAALGVIQPGNLFKILSSTTELQRLREIASGLKKTA